MGREHVQHRGELPCGSHSMSEPGVCRWETMSDVEATSYMASERELEYVDLDTYGVDPPRPRSCLPTCPATTGSWPSSGSSARRSSPPPIRTISSPSTRSGPCLGRDFISVVASPEQIDQYLELVFGDRSTGRPVAHTPRRPGRRRSSPRRRVRPGLAGGRGRRLHPVPTLDLPVARSTGIARPTGTRRERPTAPWTGPTTSSPPWPGRSRRTRRPPGPRSGRTTRPRTPPTSWPRPSPPTTTSNPRARVAGLGDGRRSPRWPRRWSTAAGSRSRP